MHGVYKTLSIALISLLACSVSASELEVLHWWTSAGEKQALDVLKQGAIDKGYNWIDFAITGGGGDNAFNVLKSRIISGNPPTAAQIKSPTIKQWGALGLLADTDTVATAGQWDKVIPEPLQSAFKVDGKYVAAPINIHRINWMWVNPEVFKSINKPIPTTWSELFEIAPLLRKHGIEPLAMGREDWQFATLFETVLLSTSGADFYRRAFVDLDPDALNSTEMVRVFETLSSIRSLMSPANRDQRWDSATAQVINGRAAIQLTGDWAKGELAAAGKTPGKDILCLPAFGTGNAFIYSVDSMVMFRTPNKDQQKAQAGMSELLMNPEFQKAFNLAKGSIPIRQDIDLSGFDLCAQKSQSVLKESVIKKSFLPSMAHVMAAEMRVRGSFLDVVEYFFKNPQVTPEQASEQLRTAITASH